MMSGIRARAAGKGQSEERFYTPPPRRGGGVWKLLSRLWHIRRVSEIASRRRWCIESLFPVQSQEEETATGTRASRNLGNQLCNNSAIPETIFIEVPVFLCKKTSRMTIQETSPSPGPSRRLPSKIIGTGLMLDGYLALHGNRHSRTAQFRQFLKPLAGKILGTRWAKCPFSRCRVGQPSIAI